MVYYFLQTRQLTGPFETIFILKIIIKGTTLREFWLCWSNCFCFPESIDGHADPGGGEDIQVYLQVTEGLQQVLGLNDPVLPTHGKITLPNKKKR